MVLNPYIQSRYKIIAKFIKASYEDADINKQKKLCAAANKAVNEVIDKYDQEIQGGFKEPMIYVGMVSYNHITREEMKHFSSTYESMEVAFEELESAEEDYEDEEETEDVESETKSTKENLGAISHARGLESDNKTTAKKQTIKKKESLGAIPHARGRASDIKKTSQKKESKERIIKIKRIVEYEEEIKFILPDVFEEFNPKFKFEKECIAGQTNSFEEAKKENPYINLFAIFGLKDDLKRSRESKEEPAIYGHIISWPVNSKDKMTLKQFLSRFPDSTDNYSVPQRLKDEKKALDLMKKSSMGKINKYHRYINSDFTFKNDHAFFTEEFLQFTHKKKLCTNRIIRAQTLIKNNIIGVDLEENIFDGVGFRKLFEYCQLLCKTLYQKNK